MKPVKTNGVSYQSYLLRLWREEPQAPWRASLQSTATERSERFANIEALFAFLVLCLESNLGDPALDQCKPD